MWVSGLQSTGALLLAGRWLDAKGGFGPRASLSYVRQTAEALADRMGTTDRGRKHLFRALRGIDMDVPHFESHLHRPDSLSRWVSRRACTCSIKL